MKTFDGKTSEFKCDSINDCKRSFFPHHKSFTFNPLNVFLSWQPLSQQFNIIFRSITRFAKLFPTSPHSFLAACTRKLPARPTSPIFSEQLLHYVLCCALRVDRASWDAKGKKINRTWTVIELREGKTRYVLDEQLHMTSMIPWVLCSFASCTTRWKYMHSCTIFFFHARELVLRSNSHSLTHSQNQPDTIARNLIYFFSVAGNSKARATRKELKMRKVEALAKKWFTCKVFWARYSIE